LIHIEVALGVFCTPARRARARRIGSLSIDFV